jgi:prophage antirepressor-like protein
MSATVEIFRDNEFGQVRIMQQGEKFFFCGIDVAKALGYSNPRDAITKHCKHDCVAFCDAIDRIGRVRKTKFLSEGDVYRLIVHSKLPSAERFEHWVFDEVLPCIRQRGAYLTPEAAQAAANDPEFIYHLAEELINERNKGRRLQAELTVTKPKADYFDAFIHPEDCTNLRNTAKEIAVPEKMFTAYLMAHGYLYRAPSGNLMPYAKPGHEGLFIVKDYYANGRYGCYTLVTAKGKDFFLHLRSEMLFQGDYDHE